MATIQAVNNGDSGFVARTKINNNDANINAALEAAEALLATDNPSLDDFQKITDAIEAIQATLSVDDANYNTLQKIVDKLKIAETKLATIEQGAEVNVQADWNETDNTSDAFIANKPTLGTASTKNVGTATGDLQENGAILGNSQTVETDATGKFITVAKNTAYNANFGTSNTDVARGDASYLKADTYTQTEIDNALATNSTDDRARANHTGEQAISTVTGLQTALDAKEATANKGVANGYASLDSNAKVPLSQLPVNVQGSKVVSDIATRDAIANADRYEGLRAHVLDASADTTVTSGSAGYILNSGLTNSDWEKTYESESLDIDLSDYYNKNIDTTDDITEGTAKFTTQADIDKLAGIEANATADQTDLEIKTAYENNANTNAFTDAEQTKLVGIDSGATANSTDVTLLNRANHTGTQTLSTISDAGALAAKNTIATGDVDNNAITTAKLEQIATKSILGRTSASTGDIEEIDIATTLKTDLNLTSTDVGLGNVNNTSDAAKPISTATQTALDAKLAKASNLSDVTNRQTSLDNLTDVANATNEYILTKDTATGNAVFKAAPGGAGGTNLSIGTITGTTLDINSDTGNDATIPAATLSNAGLLTSSDKAKLNGVEANATADQTDAEIKTAYENNADTNAFTDAEKTNLSNQSGTNTGDEVAATESVAGVGEIATQLEAETGTDNTNKFLNALKNKQAFDTFIAAHETQKIAVRRSEHVDESYNADLAPITFADSKLALGTGVSYSAGIFTFSKACRVYVNLNLSFRNNTNTTTDDTSFLEIQKSTDNGVTYTKEDDITINPSEQTNAGKELVQSISAIISVASGDKIRGAITGVSDAQFITDKILNIVEQ